MVACHYGSMSLCKARKIYPEDPQITFFLSFGTPVMPRRTSPVNLGHIDRQDPAPVSEGIQFRKHKPKVTHRAKWRFEGRNKSQSDTVVTNKVREY